MQTRQDGIVEEKLCTFHMVKTLAGDVIGVHMTGDDKLQYYRKWGDPYFKIRIIDGTAAKIKITGIADQRFIPD